MLLLASGCSAVSTIQHSEAPVPTIQPDSGIVYIFRADNSFPQFADWHFFADNEHVCTLYKNTYCWFQLEEGVHSLLATQFRSGDREAGEIDLVDADGEYSYLSLDTTKGDYSGSVTVIGGIPAPSGGTGQLAYVHFEEKEEADLDEFLKTTYGYARNNGLREN